MDSSTLWTVVKARAEADTGTGGLFNTTSRIVNGIFNTAAPANMPMPHVIWQIESWVQSDAFRNATYLVHFIFHVYVKTIPVDAATAHATGSSIVNRLRGNFQDGSAGDSTYPQHGFHRWGAQTVGDWTANSWSHRSSITAHGNKELHYLERYFVLIQQSGA